jgi:hypothetical protein
MTREELERAIAYLEARRLRQRETWELMYRSWMI